MDQTWEKAKENVRPTREGRDVQLLNAALNATKSELEQVRQAHEAAVQQAKRGQGPHAEDPLAPCVTYVKWAVEHYPADSAQLIKVVENTCRRFGKQPRYIDDPRLTRLWVRYANMRTDQLDVYQYMRDRRIGETSALFYEAWAASLELARKYDTVEKVYRLGREKRAKPAERLAQREREFYKRMSARNRRAEKRQQEKQVRNMVETQRAERKGNKPTETEMPTATNVARETNNNNKVPVRPALGTLTECEARTGHRPMTTKDKVPFNVTKTIAKKVDNKMQEPVKIHIDKKPASGPHFEEGDGLPKRMLPRKDEVSKEDEGRPTKWAGETLVQDAALKRRRAALVTSAKPVQVYTGPDSEDENAIPDVVAADFDKGSKTQAQAQAQAQAQLPAKRGPFTIYEETDKAARNDDDTVEKPQAKREKKEKRNVLTIHEDDDEPAPVKDENSGAQSSAPVTIPPPGLLLSPQDPMLQGPPSPTINTRLAMQDVDDVFNTTVAMERSCSRALKDMAKKNKEVLGSRNTSTMGNEKVKVFCETASSSNQFEDPKKGNASGDRVQVHIDVDGDKENKGGNRAEPSVAIGPADTRMETRVFHPVTQLEGVPADGGAREVAVLDENAIRNGKELTVVTIPSPRDHQVEQNESNDERMAKVIAQARKEATYHTLKSEDPESFQAMFDLFLEGNELITLDPCLTHYGETDNSFVIMVEDLNDVYGLDKPSGNDTDDSDDDSDDEGHARVALKVSDKSNIWEFCIYNALAKRRSTATAPAGNMPKVLSFIDGCDHSYMILDTVSSGSLHDVLATHNGTPVSESVCMLFAIDLLQALEGVHTAGIVHNDITLDNVLVRSDLAALDGTANNNMYGEQAWKSCGILLVDFNHAVDSRILRDGDDMQAVAKYTGSKGASFRSATYAIRGAEQWGFNIDCYGAAVCMAKLLDVGVDSDLSGRALTYGALWKKMFVSMKGLGALATAQETVACMRGIREEMENVLRRDASLSADFRKVTRTLEMLQSKRERENMKWS